MDLQVQVKQKKLGWPVFAILSKIEIIIIISYTYIAS